MPLVHSGSDKAFDTNVRTLMDERGKSRHVKDRAQALAIAYSIKRRGRAMGGQVPWQVRSEARGMMHTGPIISAVPGRTDRHNMSVPSGAYVLPADFVSHVGQNNTLAGMKVLNRMFSSGPYGGASPKMPHGNWAPHAIRMPGMSDTGGGRGEGTGEPVPVVTAGGEYVITPEKVAEIGGGDLKRGHSILDKWVMSRRKDHVKTLRKLPAPAKT